MPPHRPIAAPADSQPVARETRLSRRAAAALIQRRARHAPHRADQRHRVAPSRRRADQPRDLFNLASSSAYPLFSGRTAVEAKMTIGTGAGRAALLCLCAFACKQPDLSRDVTARIAARFGCDQSIEILVMGPVESSPAERCALGTAAVRFWNDSMARALGIDPSRTGLVRRVYFSEVSMARPESAQLTQSRPAALESYWTIQLELPKYPRDFTVWISRPKGEFSPQAAHKMAAPGNR